MTRNLALFVLCYLAVTASAQRKSRPADVEEPNNNGNQRSWSSAILPGGSYRAGINLDLDGFPRCRFSWTQNNGTRFSYRVGFVRIIESLANRTDSFNGSSSSVRYATLKGGSAQWENIRRTVIDTPSGDRIFRIFANRTIETRTSPSDSSPINAVFNITLYFSPNQTTWKSMTFDPNGFKIDIGITNWPKIEGTRVGVVAAVEGKILRRFGDQMLIEEGLGSFTWTRDAQTNGANTTVNVPPEREPVGVDSTVGDSDKRVSEVSKILYFWFNSTAAVKDFYWDPSINYNEASLLSIGSNTSGAASNAISGLLVALLALLSLFSSLN